MEPVLQMVMTEEFRNSFVAFTKNNIWEKLDGIRAKDTWKLRLRNLKQVLHLKFQNSFLSSELEAD